MLSAKAKKWLKVCHIFLGGTWGGGAAALFALHCLFIPESGPELYARNMALVYVDNYIIIPSALGCLLTGWLYSQFTVWGYLKYYWIAVKTGLNLVFIIIGAVWIIPWLNEMAAASVKIRNYALIDPTYNVAMYVHMTMAAGQAVLVFAIIIISVFKPWGKTGIAW